MGAWVKYSAGALNNLAWVMSQFPDYGWSRAVAINDGRLGHVGMTPGTHDFGLGLAPPDEWFHVVGVYTSDGGTCNTFLNGNPGKSKSCNNGKQSSRDDERFVIGGRGDNDNGHNDNVLISDVAVFNRALSNEEVKELFDAGRASAQPGVGQ